MRISTQTLFQQNVNSLNRQQGAFLEIGQQIASGKRVSKPSDDPQAASRAVGVDQAKAVTQQYMDARVTARNALSQSENILYSASDTVIRARTLLLQASSDTLSEADLNSIASELDGLYESLKGQANSTNGNGSYLFAGYKDDTPPFAANSSTYTGSTGNREQRIDASRLMEVTVRGDQVFEDPLMTLETVIGELTTSPIDRDTLRQALKDGLNQLDEAQDAILTTRASLGARLNELDVVDSVAGNRMINYEQTLSDLVDLDYVEAAADYSLRQVGLQAAQKAFVDIQGMSLFDRL